MRNIDHRSARPFGPFRPLGPFLRATAAAAFVCALALPVLAQKVGLAHGKGQERVHVQVFVIIEILIAQRKTVNTLTNQFQNRMFDLVRPAQIRKARCEAFCNIEAGIDLPQKNRTPI